MKVFRLDVEQWLPGPLREVFAFFADPQNLETITPPWLQFEIKTRGPVEMRPGALIDYRLRLHGVPLAWRSEITVWDPPRRFVDVQVRGPYRLWCHQHLFEECHGRTLVHDHVDYAVPGGRLVQKFLVARAVGRIFEFRRRKLEDIFRIPPLTGGLPAAEDLRSTVRGKTIEACGKSERAQSRDTPETKPTEAIEE